MPMGFKTSKIKKVELEISYLNQVPVTLSLARYK